jgi:uracil-DNA glycosylase family 4
MESPTIREVRDWLEREVELGLDTVPLPAPPMRATGTAASPSVAPAPAPRAVEASSDPLTEPAVRRAENLEDLRQVLGDCRRCKLAKGRTTIVFGTGNPSARLMFVGEAPGEEEDLRGEPFVGAAGQLLDRIITGGMGLRREDVYIANLIKCRPPHNRNPEPDEIVACDPFLRRQVELVRPEVLVSLGAFATQALLGDRTAISRRRGRWHEACGTPLMPTFHPSYLLRNPADKRLVWQDIQMVLEKLGLPLPPPKGKA